MRKLAVLLALVLAIPAGAAKKKKGIPLLKRPNQVAEVAGLILPPLQQACSNWAWAAALQATLALQQVPLKQDFWVQKASGGDLCLDRPLIVHEAGRSAQPDDILPRDLEVYAQTVSGSYTLDDGRKVTLTVQADSGLPDDPSALIAAAKEGRPTLLFWRNRVYLLYGVVYDEYVYPTGQLMHVIKELKLLDPLEQGDKQKIAFTAGKDNAAEIEGTMQVVAKQVEGPKWVR